VTRRDALLRLGASTAEAVARALDSLYTVGEVAREQVTVLTGIEDTSPFAGVTWPALGASIRYVDGVTGGNVFLMSPAGARALAQGMMGMEVPPPSDGDEGAQEEVTLDELELSAVGEAANQMMAAAASATSVVVGEEVEISPPQTRLIARERDVTENLGAAPYAVCSTFTIGGYPARLVQLVPTAFVMRMGQALEDMGDESTEVSFVALDSEPGEQEAFSLPDAVRSIRVRVWAELGRSTTPLSRVGELSGGYLVELDRPADASVDLMVNGLCLGRGRLLVTEEGEWAFRLEELTNARETHASHLISLPRTS
jgi:flagellar motor switch protein FliN